MAPQVTIGQMTVL